MCQSVVRPIALLEYFDICYHHFMIRAKTQRLF